MQYLLTSSPFDESYPAFSERNGFAQALVAALPSPVRAVFVCAAPTMPEMTDAFASDIYVALKLAGVQVARFEVLDARTADRAEELISQAQFVTLAGGHVPTQNAFFHQVGLRELMCGFDGVVLGISAGTMNAADEVYAQPELPGEPDDPTYQRFLRGLALTATKVLPHYDRERDTVLDGRRLYEDITYPDSVGRAFIALPDGSYLHGHDGTEEICGEAYVIAGGWLRKVCSEDRRVKTQAATRHALESDPGHPSGRGGRVMLERMNVGAHERLATWGLSFLRVPMGARMLDVGCGGGANLLRLLDICPTGHVTGVDHSATSVAASREHCADAIARGCCEVEEGNVLDLRFEDGSFDVVTAFETVYFWPSLPQGFSEVLRTLVPGGFFLVCNDDDGLSPQSHEFARTIEGMSVYTADQVAEYMERVGFASVETHHLRDQHLIAVVGTKAPA